MHTPPEDIAPAIREDIEGQLRSIEHTDGVRILVACESGSRAWGFASRDSDYDVRFLYVHPREWYWSVGSHRDVIERPMAGELDLSGWELRKALRLFRKSNPPLLEWLGSPIVYEENGPTARQLRNLAVRTHSPGACAYHYLHMAQGNFKGYLRGDVVWTKKYLYTLRPLLAILWIERDWGVVPTLLGDLVDALPLDGTLRRAIDELVDRKRAGAELGRGPRIAAISEFIESELARHERGVGVRTGTSASLEELDQIMSEALTFEASSL